MMLCILKHYKRSNTNRNYMKILFGAQLCDVDNRVMLIVKMEIIYDLICVEYDVCVI